MKTFKVIYHMYWTPRTRIELTVFAKTKAEAYAYIYNKAGYGMSACITCCRLINQKEK